MGTPMAATRGRRRTSEEEAAVTGVVMAVTSTAGAMLALVGLVQHAIPVVVIPTVVLLMTLVRGGGPAAGWASVAVWCAILPLARGAALLAPLLMIVLSVAIAVGPERLFDWVRHEWSGRDAPDPARVGWIEDDATPR